MLSPGHREDLEKWDEVGGRRDGQEGGDICIPKAGSHCCTTKTNTTF